MPRPIVEIIRALIALVCLVIAFSPGVAWAQSNSPTPADPIVAEIAKCVARTNDPSEVHDYVLLPDRRTCSKTPMERDEIFADRKLPPANLTFKGSGTGICDNSSDMRRMRTQTIKDVISYFADPGRSTDAASGLSGKPAIQSAGIRISGSIFCFDELDLGDQSLPYPLELDHSVFRFGIIARGLQISGDLSIENSFIFDNLTLSNNKIGGKLYIRNSFIERLTLMDSAIGQSAYLQNSVIYQPARISLTKIQQDFDLKGTSISSLTLEDSTVNGTLDLTRSEAACSFAVERDTIGRIVARDLGFGSVAEVDNDSGAVKNYLFSWRRLERSAPSDAPSTREVTIRSNFLQNQEIASRIRTKGHGCNSTDVGIAPTSTFSLNNNQVASLCLQSFEWLVPGTVSDVPGAKPAKQPPLTVVSISGTRATDSVSINLWPQSAAVHQTMPPASHRLEAVGMTTAWLSFNFGDFNRPYVTYVDALQLDNVHSLPIPVQDCSKPRMDSEPPPTEQVISWLAKNQNPSLQPFLAFEKAFDNMGADETDFKVAKAGIEFDRTNAQAFAVLQTSWRAKGIFRFLWEDGFYVPVNVLRIAGTGVLAWISDYGYRPAKVVWAVIGSVLLFWLILWGVLGIVAFTPDGSNAIRNIGLIFLFDRLIPVYKIREDNYDISKFYKRGSGAQAVSIQRFRRKFTIVPASEEEQRRAEACLDFLKAIGILLAGFLVAAVDALIAK
jgi:hypothetical protein